VLEHIYGKPVFIVKQMKKQQKIVYQKTNVLIYLVLKQNHQVHYVPTNRHMMRLHQLQHVHVILIDQITIMLHQCNLNNIGLLLIFLKQVVDNVYLLEKDMTKQMFEYNFRIHIESHLLFLLHF
jgi:hypothetical protein